MTTYFLGCLVVFTFGIIITTYLNMTNPKYTASRDLDLAILVLVISTFGSWLTVFTSIIAGATYLATKYLQNKTKDSNE